MSSPRPVKACPPPSQEEAWIGYLIRKERQRRQMTQLVLAGELGYGMSSISTLESGYTYANIKRTLNVLDRLGMDAELCLAAIRAQNQIHDLLEQDPQKGARPTVKIHLWQSPPDSACLPIVADKADGRPDPKPAS